MPGALNHNSAECRELFARLSAYLDGELAAEERRQIEEHLCDCPPCVEFIESLRRTVDLCHGFEPEGDPPPVKPELKQKLLEAFQKARQSCGSEQ